MGIPLGSSFTRTAAVPLDDSVKVADSTARDAIASGVRYEGMIVYVVADGLHYALIGGITNGDWATIGGGGSLGNFTVDRFSGDGSDVTFTLSTDPGSENNMFVYISGVYQQKDTYSVATTTLTFSTAPPLGTDNIEVTYSTPTSIGTPSDNTVSTVKIQDNAVTTPKIPDNAITTAKIDDGAVTQAKLAPSNFVDAAFSTTSASSTSYTSMATLSITTSGRLCELGFYHTAEDGTLEFNPGSGSILARMQIYDTAGAASLGYIGTVGISNSTTLRLNKVSGFIQLPAGLNQLAFRIKLQSVGSGQIVAEGGASGTTRFFVREVL